jgi:hypothetical protein
MVTVKDNISLTDEETDLFATLLAAGKHAGTGTTLRCAGGWVRDKLLGKDSKDIDIALDNLMGKDFAEKVMPAQPGCKELSAAVLEQVNMKQKSALALPCCPLVGEMIGSCRPLAKQVAQTECCLW